MVLFVHSLNLYFHLKYCEYKLYTYMKQFFKLYIISFYNSILKVSLLLFSIKDKIFKFKCFITILLR